jgi:DNA-binding NarL/FixJ family response regulator
MSEIIKLVVVDDNIVYRKDVIKKLQQIPDLDVVNQFSNGEELIEGLPVINPEVILLDLVMPVMDGYQTLDFLKANNPDIKTLVFTAHNEPETSLRLIGKGVKGFVFKNEGINEMELQTKSGQKQFSLKPHFLSYY